jgi:ABC-type nitrate/sulfonate/bicarbonate transport system substrate-binding protein
MNFKNFARININFLMVITVIFVMILLTLPGCRQAMIPDDISTEVKLQKVTVVLDWVPNTNHTGIYTASNKGYYKDEGLDVEIIQPTEGGSADLIAAGKGEFGISYQEQVTYARTAEAPLPVIAIAAIIQHNTSGFASPAEKNIVTPADFEGKKYGGWGSPVEEAMLKGLMKKYGADYSKLEIVNIGASDFFTSVQQYVDFTWIYYGWDGVAAEVKDFPINFMLLQDMDARLDFYTPVIIISEETMNTKSDLVKRFLRATEKGYRFAIEDPQQAAEILLSEVSELDTDIVIASQMYLADQYIADAERWGEMNNKTWEEYANWMYENELIPEKLAVNKTYTNEFLP